MIVSVADPVHRRPISAEQLHGEIADVLDATPALDIHTHLYSPQFGRLALTGIDDLLTYHYLEAELFRCSTIRPEQYWRLSKVERANLVWRTLFVDDVPLSEAARGVIAVLDALGLNAICDTPDEYRDYFRSQMPADHLGRVFELAGIESVVMTNDPFDAEEGALWSGRYGEDFRFKAALRLDRLLNDWSDAVPGMVFQGYCVAADCSPRSAAEIRRFIEDWHAKTGAVYMAVSLPDIFAFPAQDIRTRVLREAVLPALREIDVPLALMIGARRRVNPALRDAGDGVGRANLHCLEALCTEFPDNRFFATVLSRENQHELCVYARKFANLMPFGCWWFLNNASIFEEVTRERIEMLGSSFIPQHSDARVLEQVIYKWRNTRRSLGGILAEKFRLLAEDGRVITRADIENTVRRMLRTNFEGWTNQSRTGRIST